MVEKKRRCTDRRKKGWYATDDDFVDKMARLCGWQGGAVYSSLCRHIGKDQSCFPSIALIKEELNISKNSIHKGIKALEGRNVIEVEKTRKKNGIWLNNCYHLQDRSVWDYTPIDKNRGGVVPVATYPCPCGDLPLDDHGPVATYPWPCGDLPQVPGRATKGTHKREHIIGNTSCVPSGTRELEKPSSLGKASQSDGLPSSCQASPEEEVLALSALLDCSPVCPAPPEGSAPRSEKVPRKPKSPQGVDCSPEENKTISLIIGYFKEYDPLLTFDHKAQRSAALHIYKNSGMDIGGIKQFIHFSNVVAPQMLGIYAKTGASTPCKFVANFGELKRQWEKCKVEYDKKKKNQDEHEIRLARIEQYEKEAREQFEELKEKERLRKEQAPPEEPFLDTYERAAKDREERLAREKLEKSGVS